MLTDVWRDHEKIRFLAVGAWNTCFAYAAFVAVYMVFHRQLHYLLISSIAHILAVTNAFICQRFLVFRSSSSWLPAFLRFNLVQLLILIWALAGLAFLVEVLHFHPLFSQLLIMVVTVAGSYVLNRNYSFRN